MFDSKSENRDRGVEAVELGLASGLGAGSGLGLRFGNCDCLIRTVAVIIRVRVRRRAVCWMYTPCGASTGLGLGVGMQSECDPLVEHPNRITNTDSYPNLNPTCNGFTGKVDMALSTTRSSLGPE